MTDRGSTRHSRRLDDAMAGETASLTRGAPGESRAQVWRVMEAPADGEPVPDARIVGDGSHVHVRVNALALEEIGDRSMLAVSLRPRAFPARREVLLRVAEEEHAESRVLAWLTALPEDRLFENVQEVWDALGGRRESRTAMAFAPGPGVHTPRPEELAPAGSTIDEKRADLDEDELHRASRTARGRGPFVGQALNVTLRVVAIPVGVTLAAVRVVRRVLRR